MSGQWRPLYDAMVAIAQQFGDEMQLGLIPFASVYFDHVTEIKSDTAAQFQTFFSAHDNDCSISDSAIIAPAPDNAAKIIAQYDSVDSSRMVGGTPTYAAISKAREVLVDKAPKDGSPGYVILVTDGAPNCTSPTSDQIGDVRTAVSSLASLGVNTYVVGYNYTGAALDQWASAGNTSKYFNANDTSKLITAISGILTGLLPCEYSLSASVDKPTYVRVSVDGKDRPFNGPTDGWTLGADSKTITLTGAACTDLRSPGHHSVNVFVECSEVVIL